MMKTSDGTRTAPSSPTSPQSHDTHDLKTNERRRSKTTMMISPNLVAALEYDERTRAMTEAWFSTGSSSGHIPISNASDTSLLGGVGSGGGGGGGSSGGGLSPPPRGRKTSTTGKSIGKGKLDPISPTSVGGGLSPPNSPPHIPPLHSPSSPSLSKDIPVKPSAWNPYINPAPKLTITSPVAPAPSYTVSAPNSPVVVSTPEHVQERRLGIGILRGHSKTFSGPSPQTVVGKMGDQDGTARTVPRHRRYLSSLTKVDKILSRGMISIGTVTGKRSDGRRRSGDVQLVAEPESPLFEGGLRKQSQEGVREMEEVLNISPRSIPSSWRTDQMSPTFASPDYCGDGTDTVRSVLGDGESDGRARADDFPVASQRSHGRERSASGSVVSLGYGNDWQARSIESNNSRRSATTPLATAAPSTAATARNQLAIRSEPGRPHSLAQDSTYYTNDKDNKSRSQSQLHTGFTSIDSLVSSSPSTSPHSPRISISSTIYPSSSVLSHSIDIYSDDPPGRSSMSPDRESFIDLASPTFPSPHSSSPHDYSFESEHVSLIRPTSTSTSTRSPSPSRRSPDSPSQFFVARTEPLKRPTSSSAKPPLPTTPKPNFKARASAQLSYQRTPPLIDGNYKNDSPKSRPSHTHNISEAGLPPTTNLLNAQERADRVRQNKKITKLFGQNPGPNAFSQNGATGGFEGVAGAEGDANAVVSAGLLAPPNGLTSTLAAKRHLKHQRGAASMSVAQESTTASGTLSAAGAPSPARAVWPPPEGTLFLTIGGRRHSSPLSPQEFGQFNDEILPSHHDPGLSGGNPRNSSSDLVETGSMKSGRSGAGGTISVRSICPSPGRNKWERRARGGKEADPSSPTSFMDLSDEEVANDGASSIITLQTPKPTKRASFSSQAQQSLLELTSPIDNPEEDRKRKREKLAKLHRFLGSRVPLDLVLAQVEITPPGDSPVAPFPTSAIESPFNNDPEVRAAFMRRRRSSSAAEFSASWSDEIDRLKEDLNDREKAINVRRAVKMEKMFGVAPPQTLYHTRPTIPPLNAVASGSTVPPPSPGRIPTPPLSPIIFATRNPNQSAYSKAKSKKNRPSTADSSEPLIPTYETDSYPIGHALSDVYLHYRHSLNSLNDIIDRDDKESLVDLHDYLHGNTSEPPLQPFALDSPGCLVSPISTTPTTTRSERRRSLPSRTSMTSLYSEFSISTTPTENTFQTRRRRAAKLTQFFGVNYRELMGEIIDSIEKGLEEERGKGTLKPDEVQDLLQKLVKLKGKRNSFN